MCSREISNCRGVFGKWVCYVTSHILWKLLNWGSSSFISASSEALKCTISLEIIRPTCLGMEYFGPLRFVFLFLLYEDGLEIRNAQLASYHHMKMNDDRFCREQILETNITRLGRNTLKQTSLTRVLLKSRNPSVQNAKHTQWTSTLMIQNSAPRFVYVQNTIWRAQVDSLSVYKHSNEATAFCIHLRFEIIHCKNNIVDDTLLQRKILLVIAVSQFWCIV